MSSVSPCPYSYRASGHAVAPEASAPIMAADEEEGQVDDEAVNESILEGEQIKDDDVVIESGDPGDAGVQPLRAHRDPGDPLKP